MMKTKNYIKWFLFAFIGLFLVACKPTAKFEYSPTAPSAGEIVKFDATKSTVYKAKEGNTIRTYAWNFGDGAQGTGATVEHTYLKEGQYTVMLTVTDLAGQTNSTTQKIKVKQGAITINREVAILVQTSDGSLISDAKVTIQGQSVNTDQNGRAILKLMLPQNMSQVVATFEKSGFITQSLIYNVAELKSVSANLLAIKQIIRVDDIAISQEIKAQYLGASIKIPANAFVYADGRTASGVANIEFTPWDITNSDLNAMPANGVAQDAQGNIVNLISAGMISATFRDANGQQLQLAPGKTADIQMNLPLKSINNQELKIGTQIPLWYFDEKKGLWGEEGVGHIVVSAESSTGFAVHATVSHFSTWNWDYKLGTLSKVDVICRLNQVPIGCKLNAKITLADGSYFTMSNYSYEAQKTIINIPLNAWIEWEALSDPGSEKIYYAKLKSAQTSGTVIIDLNQEMYRNYVSCSLKTLAIKCNAILEDNKSNYTIPEDGAVILSTIPMALNWSATSSPIFEGNQTVQYAGTITAQPNEKVNIKLTNRKILIDRDVTTKTLKLSCQMEFGCDGYVAITKDGQWNQLIYNEEIKINYKDTLDFKLPKADDNDEVQISLFGHDPDGDLSECSSYYFKYSELQHNQHIDVVHMGC